MTDVNGSALQFHAPPAARVPLDRNTRLVRISIAGFIVAVLCVGGMLALPQIERSIISAQSARYASVRATCLHQSGHARHATAEKIPEHHFTAC